MTTPPSTAVAGIASTIHTSGSRYQGGGREEFAFIPAVHPLARGSGPADPHPSPVHRRRHGSPARSAGLSINLKPGRCPCGFVLGDLPADLHLVNIVNRPRHCSGLRHAGKDMRSESPILRCRANAPAPEPHAGMRDAGESTYNGAGSTAGPPPPPEDTMPDPIHYRTIAELGRALRTGELSAAGDHGAFPRSDPMRWSRASARSTSSAVTGCSRRRGPPMCSSPRASTSARCTGIPYVAKDLYDVAGLPTTAGTRLLADNVPDRDCTVVERLTQAGMVLLGKTNHRAVRLRVARASTPTREPRTTPGIPTPHLPGGFELGHRRRGGGGDGADGTRHRHRRFGADPREHVRDHRPEDDGRTGEPRRDLSAELEPRQHGPADPRRGRRRTGLRGECRARTPPTPPPAAKPRTT